MRLAGKVCIVTGAGSGIGRAIALAFAREGAWVAAAVFLASDESRFVMGAGFLVDGGMTADR